MLVVAAVAAALAGLGLASALAAVGDWPTWQHDLADSRFNPDESAITPGNVGALELKWAFVFPNSDAASSQPAVVGDTLYVGGRDSHFYALDAHTGAVRWSFDATTVTHTPPPAAGAQSGAGAAPYFGNSAAQTLLRDGPAVANGSVYFGDNKGYVYALDAITGALRWATKVDDFADAIITSSPLLYDGRVYVGVSSGEEAFGQLPFYGCCHFRGSVVALDAATGKLAWRYYTVPVPQQNGTNAYGYPMYGPSGVAVWASPAIDAATNTLYIGTGNNYSTPSDHEDTILALDTTTGAEKWHRQMTANDIWNLDCSTGGYAGNCPNQGGPDFDFAAAPNLFVLRAASASATGSRATSARRHRRRGFPARGHGQGQGQGEGPGGTGGGPAPPGSSARTVVGYGQKSGIYYLLDAGTGSTLWQTRLSNAQGPGGPNFQRGIQWGTSFDGHRIFVATAVANPSTLSALDPATGRILWRTHAPTDGCATGGASSDSADCEIGMPAAVSASPGVVFEGALDGKLRAFDGTTGRILWTYDTVHSYTGTNGASGSGGSISGAGAVISHGMVYVNSGYNTEEAPGTGIHGNVLLAFGLPGLGAAAHPASHTSVGGVPSGRAALARCVALYDGPANAAQHQTTTGRRDRLGHPVAVAANLNAAGRECLLTVQATDRGHRLRFQETLRGTTYQPAGLGPYAGPPDRVADWNLHVERDGGVRLRRGVAP